MPSVNPTCFHVSASSISAFKDCPTRFRLAYREGLRSAADTESQRMGTNWHAMHEVWANNYNSYPRDGAYSEETMREMALTAVVGHLNFAYDKTPASKPVEEWLLEREILLTSFIGYLWFYQTDPIEYLVSELPFELPINSPRTGLPLPLTEALRVGKIDHIVRWQGAVGALERKSTARNIAPDSDYWDKAKKDTQVSMYAMAFQDMNFASYKMKGLTLNSGERFGNTLYDVWHKPTIKPAMLTQAETAAFVASGEYCGVKFKVRIVAMSMCGPHQYSVDGVLATVEQGKKGFAIRETVQMYGARLLADIYARPDFYYVRREIARTDQDIQSFRKQLYAVYQNMKAAARMDLWVENEHQCRATYPCPYIPICYGAGADAVCDGKTTPPNYKRIFVDLTREGQPITETD